MTPFQMNLYVVDDDEAVRRSIGLLLISRGFKVQAFASGDLFLQGAALNAPGCVILDLRMPGLSGLQVFEHLRACASPLVVVFLSGHGDITLATEAMRNGASIWLPKPCSDERLLDEVQRALAASAVVAARQAERQQALQVWQTLTPREKAVAQLLAQDLPNKEISRRLVPPCDPRTVESHRARVYDKLGTSSVTEIARMVAHTVPGEASAPGC